MILEVNKVYCGDCLEKLKELPDNSIDSCVTDPPYGLGKEPDALSLITAWVETGFKEIKGSGFMGKSWDAFVPQPVVWKEILRVLKPGGYALVACGTRTHDWMTLSLRVAGFRIVDTILYCYASGFPKSLSIGKGVDKLFGNERESLGISKNGSGAQLIKINNHGKGDTGVGYMDGSGKEFEITKGTSEWEGYGTALKPAVEIFTLAQKPLSEKTYVANVLKWGVGALNIDGCRVGLTPGVDDSQVRTMNRGKKDGDDGWGMNNTAADKPQVVSPAGRFPANLIIECTCEKTIEQEEVISGGFGAMKIGMSDTGQSKTQDYDNCQSQKKKNTYVVHTDPNCPCALLDKQSGVSKSTGGRTVKRSGGGNVGSGKLSEKSWSNDDPGFGDTGGASRFFYCAKASQREKQLGCENLHWCEGKLIDKETWEKLNAENIAHKDDKDFVQHILSKGNIHPTVKPLSLMRYLCKLITPKTGVVLDPFAGSGSTFIAAKQEGFDYVGVELNWDYCQIIKARIAAVKSSVEENNEKN